VGAVDFREWGWGSDPKTVFDSLVKESRRENGINSYSGTISTKGSFVVISRNPIPKAAMGYEMDRYMDSQKAVVDKWGPALAIPFSSREVRVPIDHFDVSSYREGDDLVTPATAWLKGKGLLERGDEVVGFDQQSGIISPQERILSGYIVIAKAGWHQRTVTKKVKVDSALTADYQKLTVHLRAQIPLNAGEFIGKFGINPLPSVACVRTTKMSGGTCVQWLIKDHDRVVGSFASRQEAIARAQAILNAPLRGVHDPVLRQLHIITQTTGTNGEGLIVVERTPKSASYSITAEVIRPPKNAPIVGWCFFGLAPY
jgi:hypothetical protein